MPVPAVVLATGVAAAQLVGLLADRSAIPWAVVTKAAIGGLVDGLLVVGLVLVYRAARVVNFAQVGFGLLTVVFYLLLRGEWGWSFWFVIPVLTVGAAVLGVVVEAGIIRRFASAPRLVLTVATIAIGLTLAGATMYVPLLFGIRWDDPVPPAVPSTPVSGIRVAWFPEVFAGEQFLAAGVSILALAALALFLRRSATGIAIRGAAENRDRAATVGVNTAVISSVVWALAGVLAALAALLHAMAAGSSLGTLLGGAGAAAVGAPTMLRMLAAAVIARFDRIPTAVAASMAISVLDGAVFWSYRKSAAVDAVLLAVVVITLAVQRRDHNRGDASVTAAWEAAEELRPVPPVLASLPVVRRGVRRFQVAVAVLVLAFPWFMSPSQTLQGSLMVIYGLVIVSLVVLTGWGGQVSLGQFGFAAVGALTSGWLTSSFGLPFPLALIAASVAGAAAAVVVGLPALRIQGLFLAVTSLGFAIVAQSVLLNPAYVGIVPPRVTRPSFLGIDTNTDERAFYYLCLVVLALAVLAVTGLRGTRTGRVLIAMRDNERAAQSFGLSLVRVRLVTFAIAGAVAAIAGALFSAHQFAVRDSSFGPEQSISLFLVAIIGGLGSVWGVLLGAAYFALVTIVIGGVAGQLLASSVGVLAVLLLFPSGLGGLLYRLRDAWLRRIALRYRIFVPSLLAVDRRSADGGLVPLASRPDEAMPVSHRYRLRSTIAVTGDSQSNKTWVA